MAELKGTQVAAAIVPFTDLDTYATHDAEYGKGGFRSVDTNAKRDAIPAARKVKGMVVRVNDTGLHWTWTGSAWVEWLPKGSMVVDAALNANSTNPVQNKVITPKITSLETNISILEGELTDLSDIVEGIPRITVDTVWNATSNNPASSKAIESTISPIKTTANAANAKADSALGAAHAAIPRSYIDTTLDSSASDTRVPSTKLLHTTTSTLVAGMQNVQDSADSAYDKANAAIPKSYIDDTMPENPVATRVPSTKLLGTVSSVANTAKSTADSAMTKANSAYSVANAAIPKSKIDTSIDGTEIAHDAVPSVGATVTYVKSQRTAIDGSINSVSGRVTTLETWKNGIGNKGAANGVAGLDSTGKVPSTQLPSYVDDVIDLINFVSSNPTSGMTIGNKYYNTTSKKIFTATSTSAGVESTPEEGKIYINIATNKTYRWSGSTMAEISASLALGITSTTAFRGDYGNILYTNFGTGTNLTGTQNARNFFKFIAPSNTPFIKNISLHRESSYVAINDNIMYFDGNTDTGDDVVIHGANSTQAGVMTADMYKTFQEMELATFPLTLNIVPSSDSIFEVGASYTPTINIFVSRKGTNVTSGSNINVVGVPTLSGSISNDKQTWIPTSAVRANQKLTVTATYGSQSASKVYNVFFKYKKYWGVSTNASLTSAQVLTLGNSTWADSKAVGATTFDCTGGKYVYYVIPSSLGVPEFWVGGLKNSDVVITNANVTNASGGTTTYQIMRLTKIQTGVLSIQFK